MTGDYAYTPQVWPSLLTTLLLAALAAFSWRRRTVPGARVFAVTCLLAVPWVAGAGLEVAAVDAAGKLFWFKVQAVTAQQMQTFLEFPPRQRPAAFNLDAIMAKLQQATDGSLRWHLSGRTGVRTGCFSRTPVLSAAFLAE